MGNSFHEENELTDRPASGTSESENANIALLTLAIPFGVVACGLAFVKLADEVIDGETRQFDEWVLRSLRRTDDLSVPIGPAWIREAGLDITALGSPVVLVLMVAAVMGLMRLRGKFREMAMTAVTTMTGSLFALLLKYAMGRDRPTVVPHLREVTTPSFPSGHAMVSAVVFMTLGILATYVVQGQRAKVYCLTWAMGLTFLVGLSRIYLGVHYPTDVLAGWLAGFAWALGYWAALKFLDRHRTERQIERH